MARKRLSALQRITKLAKSTTVANIRLADQNMIKYGTNRTSELKGEIGNNGKPFYERYDEVVDAL